MDTSTLISNPELESKVRKALELDFESIMRVSILAGESTVAFRINEEGRVEAVVRGDRYVFVGRQVILLPRETAKPAEVSKPPPQILGVKGIEPVKQEAMGVSAQWIPIHFCTTYAGFSNPASLAPPAFSNWSATRS